MSSLMKALGVDKLSEADQVQLAEEIFDSLGEKREPPPLIEAQRCELQCRLALLDAHPEAVTPWAEVQARIMARLKR